MGFEWFVTHVNHAHACPRACMGPGEGRECLMVKKQFILTGHYYASIVSVLVSYVPASERHLASLVSIAPYPRTVGYG